MMALTKFRFVEKIVFLALKSDNLIRLLSKVGILLISRVSRLNES
jgi:hypothetical protein